MLDSIKEERDELLFLAGVTIVTIYFLYATASLTRPDSAAVPWVILAIMVSSLVAIFATMLFGDKIKQALGRTGDDEWLDVGNDGYSDEDEVMFEIDLWGVTKELAWIGGYIVSMLYVGFFTSTIVFINAYIFFNETSNLKRRLAYQLVWTVGVLTVLYVLFIELLRVSALFRLGFLP